MKQRLYLTLLLAFGLSIRLSAQVSLQTGAAQVSIPLYAYNNPNSRIGANIQLNYVNGNGLKVSEIASNVGTGWNVAFGGSITRIQRGEPDDQKTIANLPSHFEVEDVNYWPNGYLYSEFNAGDLINDGASFTPMYGNSHGYTPPRKYRTDREQDIFSFSFNGHNGQFVIGKNGDIKTLVDSKLKIDKTIVDLTQNGIRTLISKFIITDEAGIKYFFEEQELSEAVEYSNKTTYITNSSTWQLGSGGSGPNVTVLQGVPKNQFVVSKWYLSKIINPSVPNDFISFEYESYNVDLEGDKTYTDTYSDGDSKIEHLLLLSRLKGVSKRIKKINCSNHEHVDFNYSSAYRYDLPYDKYLSEIVVTFDNIIKNKWKFAYGYFYGAGIIPFDQYVGTSNKTYTRLCLNSLQKTGVGTAAEPPYNFTYNTGSSIVGDIVPPMFSPFQDHWGYWNGLPQIWNMTGFYVPTLTDGVPSVINTFYYQCEKIISDPTNYKKIVNKFASNGCIKSIQYPTKGILSFEYEQNTSFDNNGNQIVVGGIRVSKTVVFDAVDHLKDVVTDYNYIKEDGYTSGWGAGNDPMIYSYNTPLRIYKCGSSNTVASVTTSAVITKLPSFIESTSIASATIEVVSAIGSFVASIVAEIVINRIIFYFQADYKDYTIITKFITPANGNVLLPLQYSRVQISAISSTSNNGKTVYEFTSKDHVSLIRPNVAFPYGNEQRYCYWFYGLPKSISVFDNNGQLVKKTVNEYNYIWSNYLDQNFVSQKWAPSKKVFDCAGQISNWQLTPANANISISLYYPFIGRTELKESKEYVYKNNIEITNSSIKYIYSPVNYQVKQILSLNSKNESLETNIYYPSDYINLPDLQTLIDRNIVTAPVSTQNYIYKNGGKYLINGVINLFSALPNGDMGITKKYAFRTNTPIQESQVAFNSSQLIPNTSFYKESMWTLYDAQNGLPSQVITTGGNKTAFIYNYNNNAVAAEVRGADPIDIAYTSFEEGSGNWTISSQARDNTTAITGTKSYNMSKGNVIKSGLDPSKTYICTFWATSGSSVTITGAQTPRQLSSINGWNLWFYTITGITSANLTGTGLIDELRLYPQGSQMSTKTYRALVGVTSECDRNNKILYYQYDELGRPVFIRDQNQNILKRFCYKNSDDVENCTVFGNTIKTQTFNPVITCGTGTTGQPIVYTIPANTYFSFSQAGADAQAQSDIEANGQNYANLNSTCVQAYYNDDKSGNYYSQNCASQTPSAVYVSVPANTYVSTISSLDANNQALQYAQNYAILDKG